MLQNNEYPTSAGIYKITNIISGKCYIGSTYNLRSRLYKHIHSLANNTHHSIKMQRAYNKYGISAFEFSILELLEDISQDDLLELEQKYVHEYNALNSGYNMIIPSKHYKGWKMPSTAVDRVVLKNQKPIIALDRFSGNLIKEFNSITDAAIYFNTSPSNISGVCYGRLNFMKGAVFIFKSNYDESKDYKVPYHFNKGIPRTLEEKSKQRKNHAKSKRVFMYDINMNFVNEYYSMKQCEEENNLKKCYLNGKLDRSKDLNGYFYKSEKI